MFINHLYAFHALTPEGSRSWRPTSSSASGPSTTSTRWSTASSTDMLCAMPLPLTDLFRDGLSPWEECAELASRRPDRTVFWGSVNPLEGRRALDLMERQVGEFGAKAFKFYNVRYDYGRPFPWRMDDPQVAFPVFEKAQELGVNLIGVHKGVPLGPQPIEATQTWDMDGAAANFPDINFVIFHVGLPFIDEVCWQLIRHPNLYASIAATINFVVRAPRQFAETLGKLLFWAGEDKIIYGSEAPIWQPQWALEAFWDFQLPRTWSRATATRSSPSRPSARSWARTCCACTAWTSRRPGPGCAPDPDGVGWHDRRMSGPARLFEVARNPDRARGCRTWSVCPCPAATWSSRPASPGRAPGPSTATRPTASGQPTPSWSSGSRSAPAGAAAAPSTWSSTGRASTARSWSSPGSGAGRSSSGSRPGPPGRPGRGPGPRPAGGRARPAHHPGRHPRALPVAFRPPAGGGDRARALPAGDYAVEAPAATGWPRWSSARPWPTWPGRWSTAA